MSVACAVSTAGCCCRCLLAQAACTVMAETAVNDFTKLETAKDTAQKQLRVPGMYSAGLEKMLTSLEEVFQLEAAFKGQMDVIKQAAKDLEKAATVEGKSIDIYVRENMAKWDRMQLALQGSIDKVLAIAEKAKVGLRSDVSQFFEHAKEQIQEHIGDCRSFYVLYISTVDTACDEGVRLLAVYWSSVWWFVMLGLPSMVVALILTAHFARAAVPADVTKDSVMKSTAILTAPVLVAADASSTVSSSVPDGQPD